MKIVFYNETILSGGIEKCIETLSEYIYQNHELEIVYIDDTKFDNNIAQVLSKYVKIHKLQPNEIVYADVCFWCRLYMNYNILKQQIKAKKNFLWVHSKPRDRENCILDNKEFIDDIDGIICVSETVKNMLHVDKKAYVIHNFLPQNIQELSNEQIENDIFTSAEKLKLVTVSRLSEGKGFERVCKLVQMLKENAVEFEYIIIGKGRAKEKEIKQALSKYDEVKFIGYRENPYPYIKKADYLVQLSDFETWGNVITEAKFLKVPVIVTNFTAAQEQVEDEINGTIIDLEETDYNQYLQRITQNKEKYKENLKKFEYKNEIDKWNEILHT